MRAGFRLSVCLYECRSFSLGLCVPLSVCVGQERRGVESKLSLDLCD